MRFGVGYVITVIVGGHFAIGIIGVLKATVKDLKHRCRMYYIMRKYKVQRQKNLRKLKKKHPAMMERLRERKH